MGRNIEVQLRDALAERTDVSALACMDGRAGLVLGLYVKGGVARDDVELAVMSAPELCSGPTTDGDAPCESFVASTAWVHAFARVPARPDLIVVGVAPGGANVTLLRAWLREVAGRVGQAA
jgi:hypothetical protein